MTGRWKLGAALAVMTAALWGMLPVPLTLVLAELDAFTITWVRFVVAAVVLGVALAIAGRLPQVRTFDTGVWRLLGIALAGLVGNYVLYLVALYYVSPTVNQVVGQVSPILLLLGGVVVFHERFTVRQWLGLAVLVGGLLLFFNRRLPELLQLDAAMGRGVAIAIAGAVVWAVSGLVQKRLTKRIEPAAILLLLYLGAALVLLPWARPGGTLQLGSVQAWALVFCCANTLLAYGAFAEALRHWQASRVGAVLSLSPLFTIASMAAMEKWAPGLLPAEHLDAVSIAGALLVIGGSATCALAGEPDSRET